MPTLTGVKEFNFAKYLSGVLLMMLIQWCSSLNNNCAWSVGYISSRKMHRAHVRLFLESWDCTSSDYDSVSLRKKGEL